MNPDTPANIADLIDELVATSYSVREYLIDAIEKTEGPNCDADLRLRELLDLLELAAAMLRNRRHR